MKDIQRVLMSLPDEKKWAVCNVVGAQRDPREGVIYNLERWDNQENIKVSENELNDRQRYIVLDPLFGRAFDFGMALEMLSQGYPVERDAWDGKAFVFKQVPAHIGLEIIPKMQSVPDEVKALLLKEETTLKYAYQLAYVNISGEVSGWAPSALDLFATDWRKTIV